MDTILNIFKSLGADITFFYQLALVLVFYFVLKYTLFGKLQEVLDLRESKTTKLEGNANKKFAEAEELAQKYKAELDRANHDAYSLLSEKRNAAIDAQKSKLKEVENQLNIQVDEKRKEFMAELEVHKANVLKEADSLSGDLVNKLTN
ncbi:putative ATP synthase subunit B' [Halobacteriovorax marinus SJ]|uniref:ATP synthase subunit B n=1 Tax=Halobacteriovorax marinus (strain ATCC BAA-682 / DSM 15412 / SJ) TaxID=862908 RepID=E1X1L4_HALMS|nr:ATP synthase subunit B' [Halobacteriovorax marinus]CBW28182.1 putative ATP synthase subunit B' [Halobacteriovorax marinus SJ]